MSQPSSNKLSSKPAGRYLSTAAIRAVASSMALVSSVLGFEIVEVWSESEENNFHCTYVHAEEGIVEKYPNIITGYYPQHKRKHMLSPKLCMYARQSNEHYHWRIIDNRVHTEGAASTVYDQLSFPVRTEMAFELSGATFPIDMNLASTGDMAVDNARGCFLVAISVEKIEFKPYKLKFLSGLAVAIFVAAFDLDADDDRESQDEHTTGDGNYSHQLDHSGLDDRDNHHETVERRFSSDTGVPIALLDLVAAAVPPTPPGKSLAVAVSQPTTPITSTFVGMDTANSNFIIEESSVTSNNLFLPNSVVSPGEGKELTMEAAVSTKRPFANVETSDALENVTTTRRPEDTSDHEPDLEDTSPSVSDTHSQQNSTSHQPQGPFLASPIPSWDPARVFHFPIADIPIKYALDAIPRDLVLAGTSIIGDWEYSFSDVSHIADGSHAHIFLATLSRTPVASAKVLEARPISSRGKVQSQRCVVKMLTESALRDRVACQEFAIEFGTLARISHPHIIRLLGAGHAPRPFLVLEHLPGGTLYKILNATQQTWGSASGLQRLFRKPSFTYTALLHTALELAEACDYLHHRVYPGTMILHRDLKPDNIGFTGDGTLKLFDFGLSVCVKSRSSVDEAYEMTGYTGSLRYMAPEVVQRLPYSEACDVYSYAIVLWQMARDRVPFKGLTKEDFIQRVVKQQERPKLDRAWPSAFSSLLQRCWHPDFKIRPSFSVVIMELRGLIVQQEGGSIHNLHHNASTAHHHSGSTSGYQSYNTSGTTTPTNPANNNNGNSPWTLQSGHNTPRVSGTPNSTGHSAANNKAGIAATTDNTPVINSSGSRIRRGRMIGGMGSAMGSGSNSNKANSTTSSSWF